MDDLEKLLKDVMGELPVASFALRRPRTRAQSRRWEAEGVIVNPPSLAAVVAAAGQKDDPVFS